MEDDQQVPWDSRWINIPLFPGYWLNQYGQVWVMRRRALLAQYYNQHHIRSVRLYGRLTQDGSRGHSRSVVKLVRELHGLAEPLEVE